MANKKPVADLRTIEQAIGACATVPLLDIVKAKLRGNMSRFSMELGGHRNWLSRKLRAQEVSVPLLVLLCHRLGINLLDHYMQLQQPEHRETVQTRELKADLEKAHGERDETRGQVKLKDIELGIWKEKRVG